MNVKEKTLSVLEQNRGEYISGAGIAKTILVSRNAVWKAIEQLRQDGYDISAFPNRGYCLSTSSDILSKQSIESYLGNLKNRVNLTVEKSVDSTNDVVKNLAAQGMSQGTIVISEQQTMGRGRGDRKFYSPFGTGVYLSVLLRPDISAQNSLLITTAAAVAVSIAIDKVAGIKTGIKWVNDIFYNGKKVAGILTEASLNVETAGIYYAVLGIGINAKLPVGGFPSDLEKVATAIYENGETIDRSRLAATVIKEFYNLYDRLLEKQYLNEYRERSIIIGKEVDVIIGDVTSRALVVDIDDDLKLCIKNENGIIKKLSFGEISIRV